LNYNNKFTPLQKKSLESKNVDIWLIDKNKYNSDVKYFWEILSFKEREKALRFRFEKDKNCFVIARGILRVLLGKYILKDPKKIEFQYSENGKPSIESNEKVKFNLSHSKDAIVIGFVKDYEIGVDVEFIKKDMEFEDIANSFFSEEEIHELMCFNKKEKSQAFFNCWTRKEAFIKAEGSGLSFPLNEFVVSLKNKNSAKLLSTKWDETEKEKWSLEAFTPFENYIGAIAVRGF